MNLEKITILPAHTMRDAVARLQVNEIKILLVMDIGAKLLGTVTDGDIRRALLQGRDLSTPVRQIMNDRPVTVGADVDRKAVVQMMKARVLRHIPRVDAEGRVIGVELLDQRAHQDLFTNEVVIMAGGRGERLRPLTDTCPKPMLAIGGRPILERIIEGMAAQGFRNFTISVNYLADVITDYFGDGSRHGVRIRYVHETKRLGTAGALSLMGERPTQPILVINGDILTCVNFQNLVEFHAAQKSSATLCVREYRTRVPFGVIETEGHYVTRLSEKPEQRHMINAGIYVLNPEVLDALPRDEYCDMPDLLSTMLDRKHTMCAFHVDEDWVDIGLPDQLKLARDQHAEPDEAQLRKTQ